MTPSKVFVVGRHVLELSVVEIENTFKVKVKDVFGQEVFFPVLDFKSFVQFHRNDTYSVCSGSQESCNCNIFENCPQIIYDPSLKEIETLRGKHGMIYLSNKCNVEVEIGFEMELLDDFCRLETKILDELQRLLEGEKNRRT